MSQPRVRVWGEDTSPEVPSAHPGGITPLSLSRASASATGPFPSPHRLSPPLQRKTVPTSGISTQARAQRSLNSPLRKVSPGRQARRAGRSDCGHTAEAGNHLAQKPDFPAPGEKSPATLGVSQPPSMGLGQWNKGSPSLGRVSGWRVTVCRELIPSHAIDHAQESGGQGAGGDASESRSPKHMCPGVFQEPWSSHAPLCHGYRPTPAHVRTAAHGVDVHTYVHTHSLW